MQGIPETRVSLLIRLRQPGNQEAWREPVPVPEDEHLETWVSRALAEYSRTEDQNARMKQREEIAKARQERRMQELETLEQRVQKLRGTLETREKLKPDILKDRLDYLVREADGLGRWPSGPGPFRSCRVGICQRFKQFRLPYAGGRRT